MPSWPQSKPASNSHQTGKYAEGYTPLHLAAEKGHLEVVKLLIQNGALVDSRDKELNTPLMLAVRNNRTLDMVQYLVEHGADIRAGNNRGMMPLELASHENNEYLHSVNRKLLAKDMTLKVGSFEIPFFAKRYEPEYA